MDGLNIRIVYADWYLRWVMAYGLPHASTHWKHRRGRELTCRPFC